METLWIDEVLSALGAFVKNVCTFMMRCCGIRSSQPRREKWEVHCAVACAFNTGIV